VIWIKIWKGIEFCIQNVVQTLCPPGIFYLIVSQLTDCLTTVKGINKTDVVSLSSTFGSLANMATASKEDLSLLPGFGPLKAQRLHDLIQQPFITKRSKDQGEEKEL